MISIPQDSTFFITRLPFYLLSHSILKGKNSRIAQVAYLVPHVRCEGSWEIIDATSLVDLNCVTATCRKSVHTLRQGSLRLFIAAICRTNSKQFEFVRQIEATKFCRSDKDFHMLHEAICCSNLSRRRVAAICRIVCLAL